MAAQGDERIGVETLRVLGLFDHAGMRRHQNRLPADQRVSGPYCVQYLMDEDIDLIPVRPARTRIHRKMRDVIEHRSGTRVDLAVRGALRAPRPDAVLCLLEDKAVLPAMLKKRGVLPFARAPLAVVSCWWAEELARGTDEDRARIRQTTDQLDLILTFSRNQVDVFETVGAGHKVVPITFGVDTDWYTPPPTVPSESRFEVVAMGIDRGRDFESLVAAAALLPQWRFGIFTQPGRLDSRGIPVNVTLHPPVSMDAHRENLRSAQLVVVPTHDLAYPTGQSVLLEAMACGRCVAVTGTAAMGEYIDDGVTNLAIPLGDPAGISAVIDRAMQDSDLRERVGAAARLATETEFSFRRTWREAAGALRLLR